MRIQKSVFVFLIVLSALIFGSCAEQGPAGPAGTSGTGLICANFQNGAYPDATYAGNTDTRMYSGYSTSNYGSCNNIAVGFSSGIDSARALVKFDLAGLIPAGAVVTNAYLTLYVYYFEAETSWRLYEMTGNWTEGTGSCGGAVGVNASWDYFDGSLNSWTAPGGDHNAVAASNAITISSDLDDYITFSVTPQVVQKWLDNPAGNYGLLLKAANEETASLAAAYSSEAATIAYRPRLTVYYTAP